MAFAPIFSSRRRPQKQVAEGHGTSSRMAPASRSRWRPELSRSMGAKLGAIVHRHEAILA
jgi:hypothetical protein